jgi:hypothetical protein
MHPAAITVLAPVVNGIQLVPQLHHTLTTESVHDLSLWVLVLLFVSNLIFLAHGYFTTDKSQVITGIVNLVLNVVLFWLYRRYKNVSQGRMG